MFIDERSTNPYFAEASSDPMYMMEAVQEATEAMHILSMKMVKCEHSAIVNENSSLMNEGVKEFGQKTAQIAKTLLAKFIAFIDRVKAEWSNLYAKVITAMLRPEKVREYLENPSMIEVKGGSIQALNNARRLYESVSKMTVNNLEKANETINNLYDDRELTDGSETASKNNVEAALDFLKDRKKMIGELNGLKSKAKALADNDTKEQKAKDSLLIAKFSSMVSKVVSYVNKATSFAVKICRAAVRTKKGDERAYNNQLKKMRDSDKDNWNSKKGIQSASASILDMF